MDGFTPAPRDTVPQRGRPPDPRKRQAVLEAAQRIFMTDGYEASLDSVAREAAVSRQTIYNLYGGKDELFLAVLQARAEAMIAPLAKAAEGASMREVLIEIGRRFVEVALTPDAVQFQRAMILATHRFPKLAQTIYSPGPFMVIQRLGDYLAAESERGNISAPDPEEAADHFLGLLKSHHHMKMLLFGDAGVGSQVLFDRVERCVDLFLKAYGCETNAKNLGAVASAA